jgi:hypothetical protein
MPLTLSMRMQRALGNKIEILSYDNKSPPAEALVALKTATDQNIPILQCAGGFICEARFRSIGSVDLRTMFEFIQTA